MKSNSAQFCSANAAEWFAAPASLFLWLVYGAMFNDLEENSYVKNSRTNLQW
jgi:hypothetical protein